MLSDIEIAQQAKMTPITEIAESIGINSSEIEPYGHYKAKISDDLVERVKDNKDGKLILVTAVNPTPAGEGKQPLVSDLAMLLLKSARMLLLLFVNHHSVLFSELKAEQQAADTVRLYLWRTLTFILQVICMPLQVQITLCVLYLIITFSRVMSLE